MTCSVVADLFRAAVTKELLVDLTIRNMLDANKHLLERNENDNLPMAEELADVEYLLVYVSWLLLASVLVEKLDLLLLRVSSRKTKTF